ncbi:pullulanase-type alpha-1,6-glucosidase [Thalassotalea sp. Y01]|uniref:pullulanase-type alpha-1,6-glucosidase n=1 Tax=Thalassotalea sp. Y01 TaxID=2729613 RepID=UPI00145D4A30|nr:pullulanase-type alpha-1,6-glucosidase [Thalassotalea sp. Y01]NMP17818.1 pullulanase-type alpha-1,6-glucosidase [Thalassotalea sp. Y01]
MKTTTYSAKLLFVALLSLFLSACDVDSEVDSGEVLLTCDVPQVPNADYSACVDPEPIQCPAPTVPDALNEECVVGVDPDAPLPVYFPAENEAIIYYNRSALGATNEAGDPSYDGYRLHTWNSDFCDAYAPPHDTSDWANGHQISGIDPTYGAYWVLNLKDGYSDCGNFIIHVGTDDAGKAMGSGDFQMPLHQDDETYTRMNFTFDGVPSVFEYPVVSLGKQPVKAKDFAAHWLDANTLVWNIDNPLADTITSVKLHHSANAGIEADENDMFNGETIELSAIALDDDQRAISPRVADWSAYMGDWSVADAKQVVKGQLVVVGYDADGATVAASNVQADKVLDALYTAAENDADEAMLGAYYSDGMINVALWAPTAQQVTLKVFDAAKMEIGSYPMSENTDSGVWSYSADMAHDRAFYQFEVMVYHPQNQQIETLLVTDPYSVGLSTNGDYSQFVNLADADLMPEGWNEHLIPEVVDAEDAVIYEAHIRDFSAMDETVSTENRGKYLAFTESESAPVMHLKSLADSGLTHLHLLPANDIASINEDSDSIVNINDTVGKLCEMKSDAPVCGVEDDNATLLSVLQGYSPYTNDAAKLIDILREFDSFNWGYDPKHFNVPDGVYASDSDGAARILEMRSMIKSVHDLGLRVVLDVVYNHTNSAGLWDNSVLDKIVPGYYHSRDLMSGAVVQSTCCNDTALEHRMMDKLMVDSLLVWTEHYKYDGFRFDIMSHGSKQQMLSARDAVRAIDADNYFYGEGWQKDDRGFQQAEQFAMAGTEISTFNDRIREGIRTGEIFSNKAGEDGPFIKQDIVKLGMAGSLADYVLKSYNGVDATGSAYSPSMYALDPADVVNYISKHDNESLWDQLQFVLPFTMSMDERVRAQNVSQSIVMLSQGVPFLQMGGDMLRSKSLDRNTYDAGDWYNRVDFSMTSNNFNMGLPLDKGGRDDDTLVALAANPMAHVGYDEISFASNVFQEFLQIRQSSKLFRLTSAEDIVNRVGFHNIGKRQTQGLIVMSIDDGTGLADIDAMHDAIVVVVNTSDMELSHTVSTASGFSLHPVQQASVDATVASASFSEGEGEGTFTVPALSTAVFVKAQGEAQGAGLSAFATAGAPDVVPFGDTTVLLRGDMNGWGESDALNYVGNGVYQVSVDLAAGEYYFKIASADWSTVNMGANAGEGEVLIDVDEALVQGSNDNFVINISEESTYIFEVDASNLNAPILNVRHENPFHGTTVFVRGDMNGWSEDNPLVYIGDGKFAATITVSVGTLNFKIASGDWSTVNMGAPFDDTEVLEREEQLLVPGSNDNLNMTFAEGDYTFIFDASNTAEPTLTVYSAKMFGDTTVFIRGGMNGWGETDALTYQGDSVYSATIALDATSYEFKVASADWSTVNLGATSGDDAEVMVAVDEALVQDSQSNFTINVEEAGDYLFTVTGPDPLNSTLTVTKVM